MINKLRLPRGPILLCLLVCALRGVYSAELRPGLHAVFGNGNADFVATLQAIESPGNSWKPGKELLPVDLSECARKAKRYLLRQQPGIPSEVKLISAEIRPFIMSSFNREGEPQGPEENQKIAWYMVFTFSNALPDGRQLEDEDRTVGMMLDGTILEMVKRRKP
jgi:hypothetical protein